MNSLLQRTAHALGVPARARRILHFFRRAAGNIRLSSRAGSNDFGFLVTHNTVFSWVLDFQTGACFTDAVRGWSELLRLHDLTQVSIQHCKCGHPFQPVHSILYSVPACSAILLKKICSLALIISDILFAESARNILPVLRHDDFGSVRTLLTEKKLYF